MKILSTLFCFLLAIIALPVLLDGSADASLEALTDARSPAIVGASAPNPDSSTAVGAADAALPGPPRARSARPRRPARIDLTMPYYRFGRAPTRIKD